MAKKKTTQKKTTQKKVEETQPVEETIIIESNEEKTYVIVEGKASGQVAIKLLDPRFESLVIQFGKIGINEEDGEAVLAFDYDVVSGELPTDASLLTEFEHQLGDTVVDLLENHFDEGEVVGGDD